MSTYPVVFRLLHHGRDVAGQVIHLGAAVTAVEEVTSIMADGTPFLSS
jgi:hypothetical protein